MNNLSIIKFGGSLIKTPKIQNKFLKELASVSKEAKNILVHGGGSEINFLLDKFQIKSKFLNGLRLTDKQTLEIAELALSGKVNRIIVSNLLKYGANPVGISAKDAKSIICKKIKKLGFVGTPVKTNRKLIETLLNYSFVPVIASIACDKNGNSLNVNADEVANALACAFKAKRLIFLTDVCGVLDKNKKLIEKIEIREIPNLIKNQTITGGMIPKIKSCQHAISKGVKEVWICNGSVSIKNLKGTIIKR
ncbi:MAG: acetylglutamate kinase [Elusimicrobiota bacterium]|jgi:acetylglutamate kinase|nr:acetylglutamate kinase [Elusimicrobiota bacterium]